MKVPKLLDTYAVETGPIPLDNTFLVDHGVEPGPAENTANISTEKETANTISASQHQQVVSTSLQISTAMSAAEGKMSSTSLLAQDDCDYYNLLEEVGSGNVDENLLSDGDDFLRQFSVPEKDVGTTVDARETELRLDVGVLSDVTWGEVMMYEEVVGNEVVDQVSEGKAVVPLDESSTLPVTKEDKNSELENLNSKLLNGDFNFSLSDLKVLENILKLRRDSVSSSTENQSAINSNVENMTDSNSETSTTASSNICPACDMVFKTAFDVAAHYRKRHNELACKDTTNFYCEVCKKCYKTENALLKHQQMHLANNKPTMCPICNRLVQGNKGSYTMHMKRHSDSFYRCSTCLQTFNNPLLQKWHKCEQPAPKVALPPYRCNICDKKYKTIGRLLKHQTRFHTLPMKDKSQKTKPTKVKSPSKKNVSTSLDVEGTKIGEILAADPQLTRAYVSLVRLDLTKLTAPFMNTSKKKSTRRPTTMEHQEDSLLLKAMFSPLNTAKEGKLSRQYNRKKKKKREQVFNLPDVTEPGNGVNTKVKRRYVRKNKGNTRLKGRKVYSRQLFASKHNSPVNDIEDPVSSNSNGKRKQGNRKCKSFMTNMYYLDKDLDLICHLVTEEQSQSEEEHRDKQQSTSQEVTNSTVAESYSSSRKADSSVGDIVPQSIVEQSDSVCHVSNEDPEAAPSKDETFLPKWPTSNENVFDRVHKKVSKAASVKLLKRDTKSYKRKYSRRSDSTKAVRLLIEGKPNESVGKGKFSTSQSACDNTNWSALQQKTISKEKSSTETNQFVSSNMQRDIEKEATTQSHSDTQLTRLENSPKQFVQPRSTKPVYDVGNAYRSEQILTLTKIEKGHRQNITVKSHSVSTSRMSFMKTEKPVGQHVQKYSLENETMLMTASGTVPIKGEYKPKHGTSVQVCRPTTSVDCDRGTKSNMHRLTTVVKQKQTASLEQLLHTKAMVRPASDGTKFNVTTAKQKRKYVRKKQRLTMTLPFDDDTKSAPLQDIKVEKQKVTFKKLTSTESFINMNRESAAVKTQTKEKDLLEQQIPAKISSIIDTSNRDSNALSVELQRKLKIGDNKRSQTLSGYLKKKLKGDISRKHIGRKTLGKWNDKIGYTASKIRGKTRTGCTAKQHISSGNVALVLTPPVQLGKKESDSLYTQQLEVTTKFSDAVSSHPSVKVNKKQRLSLGRPALCRGDTNNSTQSKKQRLSLGRPALCRGDTNNSTQSKKPALTLEQKLKSFSQNEVFTVRLENIDNVKANRVSVKKKTMSPSVRQVPTVRLQSKKLSKHLEWERQRRSTVKQQVTSKPSGIPASMSLSEKMQHKGGLADQLMINKVIDAECVAQSKIPTLIMEENQNSVSRESVSTVKTALKAGTERCDSVSVGDESFGLMTEKREVTLELAASGCVDIDSNASSNKPVSEMKQKQKSISKPNFSSKSECPDATNSGTTAAVKVGKKRKDKGQHNTKLNFSSKLDVTNSRTTVAVKVGKKRKDKGQHNTKLDFSSKLDVTNSRTPAAVKVGKKRKGTGQHNAKPAITINDIIDYSTSATDIESKCKSGSEQRICTKLVLSDELSYSKLLTGDEQQEQVNSQQKTLIRTPDSSGNMCETISVQVKQPSTEYNSPSTNHRGHNDFSKHVSNNSDVKMSAPVKSNTHSGIKEPNSTVNDDSAEDDYIDGADDLTDDSQLSQNLGRSRDMELDYEASFNKLLESNEHNESGPRSTQITVAINDTNSKLCVANSGQQSNIWQQKYCLKIQDVCGSTQNNMEKHHHSYSIEENREEILSKIPSPIVEKQMKQISVATNSSPRSLVSDLCTFIPMSSIIKESETDTAHHASNTSSVVGNKKCSVTSAKTKSTKHDSPLEEKHSSNPDDSVNAVDSTCSVESNEPSEKWTVGSQGGVSEKLGDIDTTSTVRGRRNRHSTRNTPRVRVKQNIMQDNIQQDTSVASIALSDVKEKAPARRYSVTSSTLPRRSSRHASSDSDNQSEPPANSESSPQSLRSEEECVKLCVCNICNKSFAHEQEVMSHYDTEHLGKDITYSCCSCQLAVGDSELENHVLEHGTLSGVDYFCNNCNKVFKNFNTIHAHTYMHLNINKKPFKCGTCLAVFANKLTYRKHMVKGHRVREDKKPPKVIEKRPQREKKNSGSFLQQLREGYAVKMQKKQKHMGEPTCTKSDESCTTSEFLEPHNLKDSSVCTQSSETCMTSEFLEPYNLKDSSVCTQSSETCMTSEFLEPHILKDSSVCTQSSETSSHKPEDNPISITSAETCTSNERLASHKPEDSPICASNETRTTNESVAEHEPDDSRICTSDESPTANESVALYKPEDSPICTSDENSTANESVALHKPEDSPICASDETPTTNESVALHKPEDSPICASEGSPTNSESVALRKSERTSRRICASDVTSTTNESVASHEPDDSPIYTSDETPITSESVALHKPEDSHICANDETPTTKEPVVLSKSEDSHICMNDKAPITSESVASLEPEDSHICTESGETPTASESLESHKSENSLICTASSETRTASKFLASHDDSPISTRSDEAHSIDESLASHKSEERPLCTGADETHTVSESYKPEGRHTCMEGDKTLNSNESLASHHHNKTSNSNHEKNDKDSTFTNTSVSPELSCNLCKQPFSDALTLHDHEKSQKCVIIKTEVPHGGFLGWPNHIDESLSNSTFSCDLCNISYTNANSLSFHMRIHNSSGKRVKKKGVFPCEFCNVVYKYPKSLSKHIRIHQSVVKQIKKENASPLPVGLATHKLRTNLISLNNLKGNHSSVGQKIKEDISVSPGPLLASRRSRVRKVDYRLLNKHGHSQRKHINLSLDSKREKPHKMNQRHVHDPSLLPASSGGSTEPTEKGSRCSRRISRQSSSSSVRVSSDWNLLPPPRKRRRKSFKIEPPSSELAALHGEESEKPFISRPELCEKVHESGSEDMDHFIEPGVCPMGGSCNAVFFDTDDLMKHIMSEHF